MGIWKLCAIRRVNLKRSSLWNSGIPRSQAIFTVPGKDGLAVRSTGSFVYLFRIWIPRTTRPTPAATVVDEDWSVACDHVVGVAFQNRLAITFYTCRASTCSN